MIRDDFRMHVAGIFLRLFLHLLLLMFVIAVVERAIGVNRPYLRARYERHQRNCARDYCCNFFSHFVWL